MTFDITFKKNDRILVVQQVSGIYMATQVIMQKAEDGWEFQNMARVKTVTIKQVTMNGRFSA